MIFETFQPICHHIWSEKYKFFTDDTQLDTARRVVEAVMINEDRAVKDRMLAHITSTDFVPGGRILAGAGTGRDVTLINCYVMDTIGDSLDDIFRNLREAALTMQRGGGIGMDFSTLRPKGARVQGVGSDASGPLSFMDVWDAMCKTIMSAGTRRGAMMGVMRCDHPDVEDFIEAKRTQGRLTQFNMSVLVTDQFMRAVEQDKDWFLQWPLPETVNKSSTMNTIVKKVRDTIVKRVRARDLWEKILRSTYNHAEPGVIFIDRINRRNNLKYCETISATNPCGEQPLPPYGDCCLGAINLAGFVIDPFGETPVFNLPQLADVVTDAVRFLDNVLDVTNYPLKQQREEAFAKRRIGLGVMGLATAMQMMKRRYGSNGSLTLTNDIFSTLKIAAYRASAELALEKGAFPEYSDKILTSPNIAALPDDVFKGIREYGLRNGVLLTVAPTGTTALWAGNVTGGIEPVYAHKFTRHVLEDDGSRTPHVVYDHGWLAWCSLASHDPDGEVPAEIDYLVTHEDISVEDHINVMAVAQDYVDASISKTINVPADFSFDEFQAVYNMAYGEGLKSCTTYRPSETRGAVLEMIKEDLAAVGAPVTDIPVNRLQREAGDEREATVEGNPTSKPEKAHPERSPYPSDDLANIYASQPREVRPNENPLPSERPEALPGVTYKIKPGEHAYYVTITAHDGRPRELFISTKEAAHSDWTAALGRMISAIWRRGGDTSFISEELRQIHAAAGGFWLNKRWRPSVVSAIGDAIDHFLDSRDGTEAPFEVSNESLSYWQNEMDTTTVCPKCQHHGLERKEGCTECPNCGWSNCG